MGCAWVRDVILTDFWVEWRVIGGSRVGRGFVVPGRWDGNRV